MLAYMDDQGDPWNAYPGFWGPFSVIGEGGRPNPRVSESSQCGGDAVLVSVGPEATVICPVLVDVVVLSVTE